MLLQYSLESALQLDHDRPVPAGIVERDSMVKQLDLHISRQPDHAFLHHRRHMSACRIPYTAVKHASALRKSSCPVLLAEPRVVVVCEDHLVDWRMEDHTMDQTAHLCVHVANIEVVRDDEETIAV